MSSIILSQDSYKFSQWVQYPPNTTRVYSYIEARKGTETLVFGPQGLIKKHFLTPITKEDIDYAESRILPHGLPFNRTGWEHILNKHGGYLPLSISAVPEGTRVPTSNILMSVYNTDPACYWLTSYIETTLVRVWYPITVATISMQCRDIIKKFLEETADNTEGLPFKLHDFGFRGVSSEESAGIGGAAHLINFMGSDTFEANEYLTKYYGATMASFSIPASEHSTITSWTRELEFEAYKNMLEQFGGKGKILACVSDSYNIFEAIKMWGKLKSRIQELETTVVVRPDSGDPEVMSVQCVEALDQEFGHTVNSKGFKVLNNVRVIYGDGISYPSVIRTILANLKLRGYSADNIAFGMGGGLLQKCDRDTYSFAMKCSAIVKNETEMVNVYKDPFGMSSKKSKQGFLDLIKTENGYLTVNKSHYDVIVIGSQMREVYRNGKLLIDENLETIRNRAQK